MSAAPLKSEIEFATVKAICFIFFKALFITIEKSVLIKYEALTYLAFSGAVAVPIYESTIAIVSKLVPEINVLSAL